MWYNLELKEVYKKLNSSKLGLDSDYAKKRLDKWGENKISIDKKINPFAIFLRQFKDFFVLILLFALILAVSLHEYIDGAIILFVILFDAILGFIQDYRAEKSIEALKKLSSLKAIVIRDGSQTEIDASLLVPGDVVLLESGSKVPADLRILECSNLESDESILTGESVPVEKSTESIDGKVGLGDRTNLLYSGTVITKGTATAMVVETGLHTEIGKISKEINEIKKKDTPLQVNLDKFGKRIGMIVIVVCIFVFTTNALRGENFVESLLVAVSLAVAAVPQSLPAVVTISLALGVKRMSKNNALVRRLSAVETLGSTSIICSDKTGTLTKNEMTVTHTFCANKTINVSGKGYDSEGKFWHKDKEIKNGDLATLLHIGVMCNNSSIDFKTGKLTGDPTEVALLVSGKKYGLDYVELQNDFERLHEVPFDSERKLMSVICKVKGKKEIYTKGSIDSLLPRCSKILVGGKIRDLTKKDRDLIMTQNLAYADDALRVLGFAYKKTTKRGVKDVESDLIFVGLQAMIDPPRVEVLDMIKTAHDAGITTIMITGDNVHTAKAIGKSIGIEGDALEGIHIEEMSDKKLLKALDKVRIFARVSPQDKLRIVQLLEEEGEIVSMTGDGVNDALALKKSDIGVAMGIRGCDVAKDSASMVLMDDSFGTIVKAVEEGRRIYDNIKKFIMYMLSANLVEVLVIFIATLLGWPLPLTAVQLLFINVLTDGPPAVALGVDPASKNIMKKKPRSRREELVDEKAKVIILFIGLIAAFMMLVLYYISNPFDNHSRAQSVVFAALVMFEMVKIFIVRRLYDLPVFSNKALIGSVFFSVGLMFTLMYVPVLASWFKIVPLSIEFGWIFAAAFVFYLLNVIFQFFVRRHYDH